MSCEIDQIFCITISEVKQFRHLDGSIFKDQLINEFACQPSIEHFKPDRSRTNAHLAYNVLIKNQSVLDAKSVVENPLSTKL